MLNQTEEIKQLREKLQERDDALYFLLGILSNYKDSRQIIDICEKQHIPLTHGIIRALARC